MTDNSANASEPSMEDILASIRRIIDEEDAEARDDMSVVAAPRRPAVAPRPPAERTAKLFSISGDRDQRTTRDDGQVPEPATNAGDEETIFPERESEHWARATGGEAAAEDRHDVTDDSHGVADDTEGSAQDDAPEGADIFERARHKLEEAQNEARQKVDELADAADEGGSDDDALDLVDRVLDDGSETGIASNSEDAIAAFVDRSESGYSTSEALKRDIAAALEDDVVELHERADPDADDVDRHGVDGQDGALSAGAAAAAAAAVGGATLYDMNRDAGDSEDDAPATSALAELAEEDDAEAVADSSIFSRAAAEGVPRSLDEYADDELMAVFESRPDQDDPAEVAVGDHESAEIAASEVDAESSDIEASTDETASIWERTSDHEPTSDAETVFGSAVDGVGEAASSTTDAVSEFGSTLAEDASEGVAALHADAESAVEGVSDGFGGAVDSVGEGMGSAVDAVSAYRADAVDDLSDGADALKSDAMDAAAAAGDELGDAADTVSTSFESAGDAATDFDSPQQQSDGEQNDGGIVGSVTGAAAGAFTGVAAGAAALGSGLFGRRDQEQSETAEPRDEAASGEAGVEEESAVTSGETHHTQYDDAPSGNDSPEADAADSELAASTPADTADETEAPSDYPDHYRAEDVYEDPPPPLDGDYSDSLEEQAEPVTTSASFASTAPQDEGDDLEKVGGMVRDAFEDDAPPPMDHEEMDDDGYAPRTSYADPADPSVLVSMTSEEISARALASLADPEAEATRRVYGALKISDSPGSESVEGVVRDLLRPMLREWLDDNLPGMVEGMVRAEVERISARARRYKPDPDS